MISCSSMISSKFQWYSNFLYFDDNIHRPNGLTDADSGTIFHVTIIGIRIKIEQLLLRKEKENEPPQPIYLEERYSI